MANALVTSALVEQPDPLFPLTLALCCECSQVQILETVPPEILFKEYSYFSSFSDTVVDYAKAYAGRCVRELGLGSASRVIEVASNDGYLLQFFKEAGVPVVGVDPAENVARIAEEERGVPTLSEFFGVELADRLREDGLCADLLIANNVLAHVADLNGFVEGMRIALKPGGVLSIQVPYVKDMIDKTEFDTVYHEHLCYFSVTTLSHLLQRHGLTIVNVEQIPLHGGSLQVSARLTPAQPAVCPVVPEALGNETEQGLNSLEYYSGFRQRVDSLRESVRDLVHGLRHEGKRIAAYGAAAKGCVLLNYFGLSPDLIEYVVDRSPYKQGFHMPGTHQPILPPNTLVEDMPDYVLLLTWNFADEILAQQATYRAQGGKFIIPVPQVRIV